MVALDTAVLVAVLGAGALYLCLSRRFLRVLLGFILLSNAANIVVLSTSGAPTGKAPATLIPGRAPSVAVDPLPQALILTAIVISFAVTAYLTVLLYRLYMDRNTATIIGLERPSGADSPAPADAPE